MRIKNTYEPNLKIDKLEKYINEEIKNLKKNKNKNTNVGNTCNCSNMNYIQISKDIDDIKVYDSTKKKLKKKSNEKFSLKKMCKKYIGLMKKIKIITVFYVIIFLLITILIKKPNLMNQLKSQLIKYELFLKLSNIKSYIISKKYIVPKIYSQQIE